MPENPTPDGETPFNLSLVERLLAEPADPRDAAEQDLATLFGALRAPAEPHELAREREHLAAFAAARASATEPALPRRRSVLATFLAAKTTVAAAALAAVAAGAAYTGSLPTRLQNVAHETIGAPAVDAKGQHPDATSKPHPSRSAGDAKGPDATGSAAHGLCTAFTAGGLSTKSTAYASLADAAGGADQIAAYCATVAKPGSPSTHPTPQPTGKPSDHPTGKPTDPGSGHSTGKPTDKTTGKPTAPHTGKPTDAPGNG
jgi:hypothetical protein